MVSINIDITGFIGKVSFHLPLLNLSVGLLNHTVSLNLQKIGSIIVP